LKTGSKLHVGTAGDGRQALVELATVELDGKSFTSGGAMISDEQIIGYVSSDGRELRTWSGETIMPIRQTGSQRGFYRALIKSYAGVYAGRRWYGRGLGEGMLIRLRPGKAVK
jgi:hypothetical protein